MNEDNIWRFISVVIRGVNTMIRFACDLQNFIDEETGNIDFMRQNKFFGTLGMIIADLQQTALTLHAYTRVRFSFGLMDKLANLKSEFTGIKDEPLLGRGMASISQASWLRQQIRQFIREDNGNIQSLLVRVVSNCYGPLHRHLRQELSIFGPSEADRLKALWTFRDLHHGAYLRGQKYDTLFHSGGVTVAPEVPALPFLLMLGLMLNPNEFLKFIPSIRKH